MNRSARTVVPLAAAVAALLGLAGCGDREEIVTRAHTEGIYLDVGELDYQVQISRQLNPNVAPDRGYLVGLPDFVSELEDDETWYGVFVRVQNQTKDPHETAAGFEIVDTQDNTFSPIEIESTENSLAYEQVTLPPGEIYPSADSLGGDSPAQGLMLLFKIPFDSLQNRPLILKIEGEGEGDAEGEVDLDV